MWQLLQMQTHCGSAYDVSEPLNFLIEMARHIGSPFGVTKAVVCSHIHVLSVTDL